METVFFFRMKVSMMNKPLTLSLSSVSLYLSIHTHTHTPSFHAARRKRKSSVVAVMITNLLRKIVTPWISTAPPLAGVFIYLVHLVCQQADGSLIAGMSIDWTWAGCLGMLEGLVIHPSALRYRRSACSSLMDMPTRGANGGKGRWQQL